ncbi:otolith matrix protein OMM-64-like [Haliotis rubra]|uniref:otolith matrix protein OMM-64-like n=1 Tax=Haliotis rubra TaxID=36100 RepID=UPI001EE535A0|nr:otolith matrix protein OMM-64-like [Haliotis rubra]
MERENTSVCGEDATDPQDCDTTNPHDCDATNPPEDDATEPAEGDAVDPPEFDATDPPEVDATVPSEVDATVPSECDTADPPLICPPEVDAPDPPEDDTIDPPEGDAADPPLICPSEVDAFDPSEDDTNVPSECDTADPPLICPPEVDAPDPPEDDTTDPPEGDVSDLPESYAADPPEGDASEPLEGDVADGTEGVTCSPIQKRLELSCESEPLDMDHIQANVEDNISKDKVVGQHEEHTCSFQGEVHGSEQTCESQPFDVDHIQSSTEDNISEDISTDKEHPGENLLRGCPVTENEKMTDNNGEDTVTEEKRDKDEVLRDDVSQPERAAKGTFAKKDTANSSHGFVMLSPFTLTREEFDAQGNSPDLKKSSEQASVASAQSSEVAERPCSDTSYFEAGDTENETFVTGTEDEAGEEVNTGGDDEKTADNDSKEKNTPEGN